MRSFSSFVRTLYDLSIGCFPRYGSPSGCGRRSQGRGTQLSSFLCTRFSTASHDSLLMVSPSCRGCLRARMWRRTCPTLRYPFFTTRFRTSVLFISYLLTFYSTPNSLARPSWVPFTPSGRQTEEEIICRSLSLEGRGPRMPAVSKANGAMPRRPSPIPG